MTFQEQLGRLNVTPLKGKAQGNAGADGVGVLARCVRLKEAEGPAWSSYKCFKSTHTAVQM